MKDLEKRYARYAERLRTYMDARNITGEMAAEMLDAHSTTVYDLRRGAKNLTDGWRIRFAHAFKVDEDVLFGNNPLPKPQPWEIHPSRKRGRKPKFANDNIPVYGLAAGSLQGQHAMTSEPIAEVPCPPGLRDVIGAYALETRGESMIPRYFPGDRLYINPNQSVKPGDHVIVQTMRHDNSGTETWVKRLDGETETEYVVSQYNPPAQIHFRKRYTIHIHRVLSINELLL